MYPGAKLKKQPHPGTVNQKIVTTQEMMQATEKSGEKKTQSKRKTSDYNPNMRIICEATKQTSREIYANYYHVQGYGHSRGGWKNLQKPITRRIHL